MGQFIKNIFRYIGSSWVGRLFASLSGIFKGNRESSTDVGSGGAAKKPSTPKLVPTQVAPRSGSGVKPAAATAAGAKPPGIPAAKPAAGRQPVGPGVKPAAATAAGAKPSGVPAAKPAAGRQPVGPGVKPAAATAAGAKPPGIPAAKPAAGRQPVVGLGVKPAAATAAGAKPSGIPAAKPAAGRQPVVGPGVKPAAATAAGAKPPGIPAAKPAAGRQPVGPGVKPAAATAAGAKPPGVPAAKPAAGRQPVVGPGVKPAAATAAGAKPPGVPAAKPAAGRQPVVGLGVKPAAATAAGAKPPGIPAAKPAAGRQPVGPGVKPAAATAAGAKPPGVPAAKPAAGRQPVGSGVKPAAATAAGAKPSGIPAAALLAPTQVAPKAGPGVKPAVATAAGAKPPGIPVTAQPTAGQLVGPGVKPAAVLLPSKRLKYLATSSSSGVSTGLSGITAYNQKEQKNRAAAQAVLTDSQLQFPLNETQINTLKSVILREFNDLGYLSDHIAQEMQAYVCQEIPGQKAVNIPLLKCNTWNMLNRCHSKKNYGSKTDTTFTNNPYDADEDEIQFAARRLLQYNELYQSLDGGLKNKSPIDVVFLQEVNELGMKDDSKWMPTFIPHIKKIFINQLTQDLGYNLINSSGIKDKDVAATTDKQSRPKRKHLITLIRDKEKKGCKNRIIGANYPSKPLHKNTHSTSVLQTQTGDLHAITTDVCVIMPYIDCHDNNKEKKIAVPVHLINGHLDYGEDYKGRIKQMMEEYENEGKAPGYPRLGCVIMAGDTNRPMEKLIDAAGNTKTAVIAQRNRASNFDCDEKDNTSTGSGFTTEHESESTKKSYDSFVVHQTGSIILSDTDPIRTNPNLPITKTITAQKIQVELTTEKYFDIKNDPNNPSPRKVKCIHMSDGNKDKAIRCTLGLNEKPKSTLIPFSELRKYQPYEPLLKIPQQPNPSHDTPPPATTQSPTPRRYS